MSTVTGSAVRSISQKLSESPSIRDWDGVVGDGVHDDTAGIQAAIDWAQLNGGHLLVPAGAYKISGDPALLISSRLVLEGLNEATSMEADSAVGALFLYDGTGVAFRLKHPSTDYVYRIKLKNFRLSCPTGVVGGTGFECIKLAESEFDHVVLGDAYSSPTHGFTRQVRIVGSNQCSLHDCVFAMAQADGVGIDLDSDESISGYGINSRIVIARNNFFRNPKASIKIANALSVTIKDNWFEACATGILIDSAVDADHASIIGLYVDKNYFTSPADLYPEYADPRFVRVTHSNTAKAVYINNAFFTRNFGVTSTVAADSPDHVVEFDYATSTVTGNDNAFTWWRDNALWGANVSGFHADSDKVHIHSSNTDCKNTFGGTAKPNYSGSAKFTDMSETYDTTYFETPVYCRDILRATNSVGAIQVEGPDQSQLQMFRAGTQVGSLGFWPAGNDNLAFVNSISGAGLYLITTGGGVINVQGPITKVGPTYFPSTATLAVKDATATTGNTQVEIHNGPGQSASPLAGKNNAGTTIWSFGSTGRLLANGFETPSGVGGADIVPGDATNAGYFQVRKPDGTVLGYIGHGTTDLDIFTVGSAVAKLNFVPLASCNASSGQMVKWDGTKLVAATSSDLPSLPNVGTAGTYRSVTTDAQGRVTAGTNPAYPPTTQSVVTGSRAIGTTYQNTGSTPRFVSVTIRCTAAGGSNFGQASAITDSSSTPTTVVATTFNGNATASQDQTMSFWVLPGNYYRVSQVTTLVSLGTWVEWS